MKRSITDEHPKLTDRQAEVLERIARGRTNAEIAADLGIGFETVKMHVSRILAELGVSSREEAAEWWHTTNSRGARMRRSIGWLSLPKIAAAGGGLACVVAGAALFVAWFGDGSSEPLPANEAMVATPGPAVPLIGTRWELVAVDGDPVPPVTVTRWTPTLTLQPDGNGGGYSGCNAFGGKYTLQGSSLVFGETYQHAGGCGGALIGTKSMEQAYLDVLLAARAEIRATGHELSITGDAGTSLEFIARLDGDYQDLLVTEDWVLYGVSGFAAAVFTKQVAIDFARDGTFVLTTECGATPGTYKRSGLTVKVDVGAAPTTDCTAEQRQLDEDVRNALASAETYLVDGAMVTFKNPGAIGVTFRGPDANP
ncbi:hypothetical protein AYO38_03840 [bacterium SCGC AG-212-C10]|nr:hypothetical protein AYO38_03840 [bacterium SCGC AG-212-C10]